MAIKNNRAGGTDYSDPARIKPDDLNDTFDRFANSLVESTVTFLEGINFNTELAQNNSISDKSYTYAFTDYFSDSDGYNNSIDSSNTTAKYYSSNNLYSDSINWNFLEYSHNQGKTVSGRDYEEIYFKPDGTKFYYIDNDSTPVIYQYNLTAWDISTSSQANSLNTQSSNPKGIFLNDSGTKLFECNDSSTIYEWDLSTPWDLSTATYNNVSYTSSQTSNLKSIFFEPNGDIFFEADNSYIYKYNLSTSFDLSTRTFQEKTYIKNQQNFTGNYMGGIISFYISNDGKKLVILANEGNTFDHLYAIIYLENSWEINSHQSIPFDKRLSNNNPAGIFAKDDGSKIFILDRFGSSGSPTLEEYIASVSSTGTELQTKIIKRLTKPSSILVSIPSFRFQNIKLDISSDGGNNFELTDVNPNEVHNLDGDDNRIVIKFKLVQNGNPYYLRGFAYQVWEN